jgi:hypothetical protein
MLPFTTLELLLSMGCNHEVKVNRSINWLGPLCYLATLPATHKFLHIHIALYGIACILPVDVFRNSPVIDVFLPTARALKTFASCDLLLSTGSHTLHQRH